jgi:hypothetical protein
MTLSSYKSQTKNLVNDYLSWRLAKAGHTQWIEFNQVDLNSNGKERLCVVMRRLAYEFEKRYNKSYPPMHTHVHLTDFNCRDVFSSILVELFYSEASPTSHDQSHFACTWARLIGLFSFAGMLAVKSFEDQMPHLVYKINEWLVDFLINGVSVKAWLASNGLWVCKGMPIEAHIFFLCFTTNTFSY